MEECLLGARILVVDDDPAMRQVLTKVLMHAQYDVEEASNSAEAIDRLSERRFDLLLSDIRMVPIDGLALASMARTIEPALKILLVTAYGERADARDARAAGADGYLSKPFRMRQLLTTVRMLIRPQSRMRHAPGTSQ